MVFRAWIGLNAADALLTWLAFSMGAVEANTILSVFASSLGSEGMLLVKILFAVAVGGILWNRRKARVLIPLNWAMVGVITYNMLIMVYVL